MTAAIRRARLAALILIILFPSAVLAAPVEKLPPAPRLCTLRTRFRKTVPDSWIEKGYEETYKGKTALYIFLSPRAVRNYRGGRRHKARSGYSTTRKPNNDYEPGV
jgi:hypothetical protein